jgi:aminoglycoside phosphotransferase (APT) family kinase protein
MAREHRVLTALAGTAVPVPATVALCEDAAVTGAPFYVMEFVEGAVVRDRRQAAALDDDERTALARAMVDVLADLHAVDPAAVGLHDFGRPEGFMARQVRRWSAQLDASRSRELTGVEELRDGLAASVPPSGAPAVVHGDYRLDNLVVRPPSDPPGPTVRAVLDWEMATLGDPLADVGLLVAYWDGLGSLDNPVAGLGPAAGFPDGARLTSWYAEAGGHDVGPLPWYVAFGFFKIAVILEGIHYRFVQGQTVGAGFDRIGAVVPLLVDLGRDALARVPDRGW